MKKKLFFLLLLFSITIFGQEFCATDYLQAKLEAENPEEKKAREKAETDLLKLDKQTFLKKIGAYSRKNAKYTGTIYEIPVVVHVIESSDPTNSYLKLTDKQIQDWINNANKMYATTYGNGFPAEGNGSLDGTVIPFKLVLAKRTPQCTPTSGIVRYNGSVLPNYDQNGVQNQTTIGVTTTEIMSIAPHWPESDYYNIYIIIGTNGNKYSDGVKGWAGYPYNADFAYHCFMKVTAVTDVNDPSLAHEFGHSMGLKHTFEGTTISPTTNPVASDCPSNDDCTKDNDGICDTEPAANLLYIYPLPTNSVINPCTGANYNGIQYNIMNYSLNRNKFTPGQRDKGLELFMLSRSSLITSNGAKDLSTSPPPVSLKSPNCSPTKINNPGDYFIGPTEVNLGSIKNTSSPYTNASPQFYIDYGNQACSNQKFYTDLQVNTPQIIKIGYTGTNSQVIKAWIDYNNDGIFDNSEMIANSNGSRSPSLSPLYAGFTPPATSVQNTYLRMRVRADFFDRSDCQNLDYGQVEDYAVRITNGTLETIDTTTKDKNSIVYTKEGNKLTLVGNQKDGFGAYTIYDVNGKIIQKGNTKSNEITIGKSITSGMYILNYKNGTETKKFIK